MSKQKKRRIKNPVAKNMETFCRPDTHRDKTKYSRQDEKNRDRKDPYFLAVISIIGFLYNVISILMLKCLILYKHDEDTGGAWWPMPLCEDMMFTAGYKYKIYGVVYVADTLPFREAMSAALCETTWNAITEKADKSPRGRLDPRPKLR